MHNKSMVGTITHQPFNKDPTTSNIICQGKVFSLEALTRLNNSKVNVSLWLGAEVLAYSFKASY